MEEECKDDRNYNCLRNKIEALSWRVWGKANIANIGEEDEDI